MSDSASLASEFTRHAGVEVPLICGPMYPCSNPELVAAASEAGALGVLQPASLTYVHGYDFRDGIRFIRRLTSKPIGMNALIEASSKRYMDRMTEWIDIALEEGVRFFITSLGKPRWVVDRVHAVGGIVYHDVTERKWAEKGLESGVDGLIAVNRRAGGHAGARTVEALFDEVSDLGVPVVCAGGVGSAARFAEALHIGYAGVQCGTRFIATEECNSSDAYKQAILDAQEDDIVLSERVTGIPLAVINTPYVQRTGTKASALGRWLLRHKRTKHWMRAFYSLRSFFQLKRASIDASGTRDYWQAGKSAGEVHEIVPAGDIVREFAAAARAALGPSGGN
ncbi:MAG TPA: nitronate monooxygenase [Acidobacteriota bacterium]|nr:nitronate monooxygenase [Acidobacteriota bacterium]